MKRILLPLSTGLMILAADQGLKAWIRGLLTPNESYDPLNWNWLQFTRVPNGGLIFQTFSIVPRGETEFYVRYLPTATFLVFLFSYAALRFPDRKVLSRFELTGLSLFGFGAASNLFDHWTSYYVDDTIKLQFWPNTAFHPFNLADVGILCGLVLLFFSLKNRYMNLRDNRRIERNILPQ